jgi:hypothetical protein
MSGNRLTPLQRRVLRVLARLDPPWTLTGGGALVGFHLGHRETRDLDLFWRNRRELGDLLSDALGALRSDGLDAKALRTAPAFAELRVTDGTDACIVDLVSEPFAPVEAPVTVEIEGATIAVDSRRELLASKVATLLERSEVRDLADVKALLDAGGDLEAGLRDAPLKDAGFSPLTLAWVLKSYDPRPAATALGLSHSRVEEIVSFRQWLIDRLTSLAAPE